MRQAGWRRELKRAVDVVGAAAGLAVTSPIILASAAAVRVTMGSPVLFRQKRPGLGGRPFELVKLKTMKNATQSTNVADDSKRITRLGSFLRAASIDELPTLFNVLAGDMSLVGPRPLLTQYLSRYDAFQARRHEVLPGLTGWAQVNGRNAVSWEEKFALDVWYVDHWSLALDARILAKTFATVLLRTGISHQGHVTMPEFMGSELTSRRRSGSCRYPPDPPPAPPA
ncbi:MAG: sugar transferase [Deltaproteobacteria bacterium]|nr:sugar transferase [Deltaproteobacteria bacterium]